MAKAILSEPEREEALDQEAMILMIPGYLWNVLVKQAKAERSTPGVVLSKAMKGYLEQYGTKEAVDHLWSLAERNRVAL
jgi:hypothetical protein